MAGDGSQLFYQTLDTYNNSAAPGTLKNRHRQAQAYIEFALLYNVSYLSPSPVSAAMYVQYLANIHTSPASIKNYISGAKHWIISHLGDPTGFTAFPAQQVLSKVTKESTHVSKQALPISPVEVRIIIDFLDGSPNYPLAVKPCLLISFACMFRASNSVSPSGRCWGGAHTLKASDVIETPTGLDVIIRSTKTTTASRPVSLHIDPIQNSPVCPVAAWRLYYALVSPPPAGPAFIHVNSQPLTAGPVVSAIRAALGVAGYLHTNRYSIHSLRRGAAQLVSDLGAPSTEIMQHGLWSSRSGLSHYVTPISNTVPGLIAHGLANSLC